MRAPRSASWPDVQQQRQPGGASSSSSGGRQQFERRWNLEFKPDACAACRFEHWRGLNFERERECDPMPVERALHEYVGHAYVSQLRSHLDLPAGTLDQKQNRLVLPELHRIRLGPGGAGLHSCRRTGVRVVWGLA